MKEISPAVPKDRVPCAENRNRTVSPGDKPINIFHRQLGRGIASPLFATAFLFGVAAARAQSAPPPSSAKTDAAFLTAAQGLGPITLKNMRPFNLLFLQFRPELPDTLPARSSRFSLQLDAANNLLNPRPQNGVSVLEDNELQRLAFGWRRGVGHGAEVSVNIPLDWRNGGFMDGILSAYHAFFGLPGNAEDDPKGRESHPKYQSILQFTGPDGKSVVHKGNAFGLGDVSVTWKQPFWSPTRRSALGWRAGVKIPTGNPNGLLGSGAFDAGLSLDGRYNVGRDFIFFANAGAVLTGRTGRTPNAERGLVQLVAGVEYHPNHRDSFVAQVDGGGAAVRTGNPFADRANVTATFGYKRRLDRHMVLSAAFSENGDIHNYTLPGLSNIGPDFTVSTGVEWRP